MSCLRRIFALFWLSAVAAYPVERWDVQFFYDENKSLLVLNDIKFCSAERGVAVGQIIENRKKVRPVAVVTNDGGAKWTFVDTKEVGRSLFFLNENNGWMVTPDGIWFTDETGRSWRRIRKEQGLERVYFVTPQHGYAIGTRKRVLETKDAGKTWTNLPAAEDLKTSPERTSFTAIAFAAGKAGIITGRSHRPEFGARPFWLEMEVKRERPSLAVFLETRDGGNTWSANTASLFGRFSHVQLNAQGQGLALLEYDYLFDYPSEVHGLDLRTGKTAQSLRRKDLAATDIAVLPDSATGYVAGFEPSGLLSRVPIPGKLRVFRSTDLAHWSDMQVDYRAVATRVSIGAWDADHVWLATDTGMILRLKRD